MDKLFDLTGRVAVVTGGGTGIGAAAARILAEHGADVAIAARTVDDLDRTSAAVTSATGRRCLPVPTDVKDEQQVTRLVQRTVDELGRVDILVNNAGGTRMGPLAELPTKAWDASFDLNVRSAYLCTREVGRHLIEQRSGAIVNISSGAGLHGVKGGAHYASSKAALQMFTTVTAAEWGRYGVRANCLAVGGVASPSSSSPATPPRTSRARPLPSTAARTWAASRTSPSRPRACPVNLVCATLAGVGRGSPEVRPAGGPAGPPRPRTMRR
jgi:citronellol/citronellal dehydrogenase